jgi:hypothetical protein
MNHDITDAKVCVSPVLFQTMIDTMRNGRVVHLQQPDTQTEWNKIIDNTISEAEAEMQKFKVELELYVSGQAATTNRQTFI